MGHLFVYEYRMRFFMDAIASLDDYERNQIQLHAIASRGAQVEDFEDFLDTLGTEDEPLPSQDDFHARNLEALNTPL